MMRWMLQTRNNVSALILRVMLGVVIFPHGAQKLLGWFGGYGFQGTMGFFTGTLHIPPFLAAVEILTEFFAPLALILGFFTRLASFGIGVIMLVAIVMVHGQYGFFMNWSGVQKGEGFEFHLLALSIVAALIIEGSGRWSIDRRLLKSRE